jgi:hypothetical protein
MDSILKLGSGLKTEKSKKTERADDDEGRATKLLERGLKA